ncbi:MAG: hypothetical protein IGS03_16745 [Candidatus Sericytochromatia bacterium]|nr:hypothetical protein [Candidatus Sericytochromatia bacterium]
MSKAFSANFDEPFSKQAEFFRAKLGNQVPTEKWTDMQKNAHDKAFTVAGAMKADLLADLAQAVDKAMLNGGTLQTFRADFADIVKKHGWDYNGEFNWRTKTIYMTNLRTSMAAGRLAQLQEGGYPYWVYRHSGSANPRHQHKAWNGLTLPADDPFWQTHYPPNGWGCGCRVVGIRKPEDARRYGGDGKLSPRPVIQIDPRTGTPVGIDKGWDYMPGATAAAQLRGMTPELVDELPKGKPVMDGPVCKPRRGPLKFSENEECPGPIPKPRLFDASKLLKPGLSEVAYINAFLGEFGASMNKPVTFTDVTGERLLISDELFTDRKKTAKLGEKVYKVLKNERYPYLPMLAQTIIDPQEIWLQQEEIKALGNKLVWRRRYLAWWILPESEKTGLAVFESIDKDLWSGITTFVPEKDTPEDLAQYLNDIRKKGVLEYPKK